MITKNIDVVFDSLRNGNVAGIPTETVYGLAANAFDENAVNKIFELKNRPFSNPLILHTHSIEEVEKYTTNFPLILKNIAKRFWPGPLTILLNKNALIADKITSGSQLVAVRIPDHPLVIEILKKCDFPLVAPSANPYQRISPTNANQVYEYFGEQLPFILDGGNCNHGIESTIIGLDNDYIIIYREGAITIEALKEVYENVSFNKPDNKAIMTSGMSKVHYAPKTKMIVVDCIDSFIKENPKLKVGVLKFDNQLPEEIAREYYSKLYEMDKLDFDIIITQKFEDKGLGRVLNSKLERALSKFK